MSRVLVAGATGVLGRHLVPALKARGHHVRALARSRARSAALLGIADEVVTGDALDPRTLDGSMREVDAVIACVGASVSLSPAGRHGYDVVDTVANANLVDAARAAGVARFVYVAAHVEPGYAQTVYIRAHEYVVTWLGQSGLPSCVVRPTAFFTALDPFVEMAALGVAMIPGDGRARTNPVHPIDVAEACVDALSAGDRSISVGGPDVMTREDVAVLAFQVRGRTARVLHVPPRVMLGAAACVRPLHPRLGQLLEFAVNVATNDCVAAPRGRHRLTDYFASRTARH